jgi:hypothetical protein
MWMPWWRLAVIFSSKVIPHIPVNNLWKFDVNLCKTNCFMAFLLKKLKRSQNTVATLYFLGVFGKHLNSNIYCNYLIRSCLTWKMLWFQHITE